MKKAIIIFGSPRKNGNTHILVKEAQRELTDSQWSLKTKSYWKGHIIWGRICWYE